MSTIAEATTTEGNLSVPTVKTRTYAFYIIALVATVFDCVASYISIAAQRIAEESNWLLNQIFAFVTDTLGAKPEMGFAVTMSIRGVFGIALLTVLLLIVQRRKNASERRIAVFGLGAAAVVLSLVACYHVVGMTLFS